MDKDEIIAQGQFIGGNPYGDANWDPPPNPRIGDDAITESSLAMAVNDISRRYGWRKYHTANSRRSEAGFPDTVLVNPALGRVIFAELKTMKGRLSEAQRAWLSDLRAAGAEAYVWRPDGLGAPDPYIYRILKGE